MARKVDSQSIQPTEGGFNDFYKAGRAMTISALQLKITKQLQDSWISQSDPLMNRFQDGLMTHRSGCRFVHHNKLGVQLCLQRILSQQSRAERMDRTDGSGIDFCEPLAPWLAPIGVVQGSFDLGQDFLPNSAAHFCGSSFSKSNGNDFFWLEALPQEFEVQTCQSPGLASSGAGADHSTGAKVNGVQLALVVGGFHEIDQQGLSRAENKKPKKALPHNSGLIYPSLSDVWGARIWSALA